MTIKDLKNPKNILALSWNIGTNPKLYLEIAQNPYCPKVQKIISEKFPNFTSSDVIKAIILAEPDGKYDRIFGHLSGLEQKNTTLKINKRLQQCCQKQAKQFYLLSKEDVYDILFLVAFETADVKEIERKFSQQQRLDFKLMLVDLAERSQKSNFPLTQKIKLNFDSWPMFKLIFAVLSIFLLFYIANSMYHKQIEPIHAQNPAEQSQTSRQVLGIETQPGLPVRLIIPEINVNAQITGVGITRSGAMAVPNDIASVGWFTLGVRPGEVGSAVVAGHLDGKNGEVGVFANLNRLKIGDKLTVEDDGGGSTVFVVKQIRTYDPGYANDVFGQTDKAHLNLITCDGVWDVVSNSYTKRLVVFADITN